ncbi:ATP-binding cassette domain-containing protein [Hymenobacter sp. AT01-02]|uniref:ATP-binding cassette domain-containing protein n=1 Tax=Hymenobacter sp. AT01-02 TaxID=1571877 RepID=UPI00092FBBCE|nr:ATP-binding cassette domain-containing protein [Hymenobacter sp. AT01-02]
MTYILEAKELRKQYADKLALRGLNLQIAPGEVFCLLGQNGAGKSTTINLFLGFVQPTAGAAFVNGLEVATNPIKIKEYLAYIPEQVMLYPHLTGLENLALFSSLAGYKYPQWELVQYLTDAGLPAEAVQRRVGTYSKGMRQKVGIAIAVAKHAKVLLLDEPTSGLDPKASNEFSELLRRLSGQGTAVLMATHDIFRAKEVGTRVGIMREGELVDVRPTATLNAQELEQLYLTFMKLAPPMMHSIAQKEFISTLRDRRFGVLSALVLALLLAATLVGRASYRTLQQERQLAQATVNEQFRNQPARHPHRVAHYGSFAFRPKSGLSLLDAGVDSFTGSAVFLEAHQQNSVNFSPAQQSGSLIRFGEMTVAFVLQLLVPLLIIFLCFGAFTQERETGTLKLLLSQGVTMRQVAWGKILGYSQAVALVVAPALALAAVLLFTGEEFASGVDLAARLTLFVVSYAVYFFLFVVGAWWYRLGRAAPARRWLRC